MRKGWDEKTKYNLQFFKFCLLNEGRVLKFFLQTVDFEICSTVFKKELAGIPNGTEEFLS